MMISHCTQHPNLGGGSLDGQLAPGGECTPKIRGFPIPDRGIAALLPTLSMELQQRTILHNLHNKVAGWGARSSLQHLILQQEDVFKKYSSMYKKISLYMHSEKMAVLSIYLHYAQDSYIRRRGIFVYLYIYLQHLYPTFLSLSRAPSWTTD